MQQANSLEFFRRSYCALTGNPEPFPWQEQLFLRFYQGDLPSNLCIPTGCGKTSAIAVWLLALAYTAGIEPERVTLPRRLVWVVNRRVVVDQATAEAEDFKQRLGASGPPELNGVREALRQVCGVSGGDPLAVSTLRGQFADNAEWRDNPARPAIVIGTVDMIGSRLLFSGYGVGFKAKPLHAGFLGQQSLIVHDEAHLEPAFQKLLEHIAEEQVRCKDFAQLRVMEVTATTRSANGSCPFELTAEEKNPPKVIPELTDGEPSIYTLWRRLKANKKLVLTPVADDKTAPGVIARIAQAYKDQQAAILVFVRSLDAVVVVQKELERTKRRVVLLTGTIRGKERDELVEDGDFKRFLKGGRPGPTVYLVCTSAGEVGIDISADHLVCDLSTFDSMAQRFGRVNRYGLRTDTRVDVVYSSSFDDKDKLTPARRATLEILAHLDGEASPKALEDLRESKNLARKVEEAFAPEPFIPPVTDILFDAWALTSITEPIPGRPPVEPYLHGMADWQPPETDVAWRQEVGIITDDLLDLHRPEDLLDDYRLLPHEMLRDRSDRVLKQLEMIAMRHPESPAWIMDERGGIEPTTMSRLADKERKGAIENKTVLLSPRVGGLTKDGMLDGKSSEATDVADGTIDERGRLQRQRVWDDAPVPKGMRAIRIIDIKPDAEEAGSEDSEAPQRLWRWCDRPREGGRAANRPIPWKEHVDDVVEYAKEIISGLALPEEIADAVIVSAELHDHGKRRERFQFALGNRDPRVVLAKSNGRAAAQFAEPFRHEFASVLDAAGDPRLAKLEAEMKDLVLHLIAAHHGRARPHFNSEEAFDPEQLSEDAAKLRLETPRRFARLQRKYGRWGLAYLESLLRAADWAASAAVAETAK